MNADLARYAGINHPGQSCQASEINVDLAIYTGINHPGQSIHYSERNDDLARYTGILARVVEILK